MKAARIVAYLTAAVVSAVLLLKLAFWIVSPNGQIWMTGRESAQYFSSLAPHTNSGAAGEES